MTKEEAIKILEPKTGWAALMSYDYNLERQSHVINEACAIAVAALRAQEATPPNGPLTLEELRQMNGEPVFIKLDGGYWGIVDCDDGVIAMPGHGVLPLACSGRFVYRRGPEEAQHER